MAEIYDLSSLIIFKLFLIQEFRDKVSRYTGSLQNTTTCAHFHFNNSD